MISCINIQPPSIISFLIGGMMNKITCEICNNSFIRNSLSKVCSLKCRIIQGCKKLPNGCWEWQRLKTGDYGKVRWESKTISAHRASYLAFKGNIPKGKWVCHTCDYPLCVNPDHLWIGTAKENAVDKVKKGRGLYREKNIFGKHTKEQIEEIKLLKKEGFTYKRLCRIFNCSTTHIYNVIRGKYYGL